MKFNETVHKKPVLRNFRVAKIWPPHAPGTHTAPLVLDGSTVQWSTTYLHAEQPRFICGRDRNKVLLRGLRKPSVSYVLYTLQANRAGKTNSRVKVNRAGRNPLVWRVAYGERVPAAREICRTWNLWTITVSVTVRFFRMERNSSCAANRSGWFTTKER